MKTYKLVLGFVEYKNKTLFLKKDRGPFKEYLNFPGGKIDDGESPETAIKRELKEETGLETKEVRLIGKYTEKVRIDDSNINYHDITIFKIVPVNFDFKESDEGKIIIIPLSELSLRKDEIFPSNYRIICDVLAGRKISTHIEINKSGEKFQIVKS